MCTKIYVPLTDNKVPSSASSFPFLSIARDFSKVIIFVSRAELAAVAAVDLLVVAWLGVSELEAFPLAGA